MTFTTPCFIRVEDAEKRKELIEGLKIIGYEHLLIEMTIGEIKYLVTVENAVHECPIYHIEAEVSLSNAIDCGEDTDLFLALAAMRDDTDDRQWFTDGVDWGIFHQANPEDKLDVDGISFPYLPRQGYNIDNFHKATAAEIVKHYKNKR